VNAKKAQTGVKSIARRLESGPRLHPRAWIAPGAVVFGEVSLGEEASVWYRAVLRGDINRIVVGPRSNLQDGVIVHVADNYPALIGAFVTVGHAAIIHACTVDDEVLVGMGAILLDGAEIGARSIIGAGALVTVGMKVPPGSLVLGSPGRVVRQLDTSEQAALRGWATKYVEVMQRHRDAPSCN
jgi:carbonic anhydrase/acetyltransferase-like protein (isoleucine patch superfamily)